MSIELEKLLTIKRTPPLFVIGCQRSGTSFLYRVLSEILDIGFGRDNTLFLRFFESINEYGDLKQDKNLRKLLNDISQSPVFKKRFSELQITSSDFINSIEIREYPDIIRSIYAFWALEHGKSSWGGKTPDYTGHIKPLTQLFPDVKIIHIVRDGRDVALSLFALPWGPKDVYVAANYWKKRVALGSSGKIVLNENFFECKYEDFLEKPEEIFYQLLQFLDYEGSLQEKKILEFREKIVSKIKPHNTYKWKTKMRKSDIRIFELTAREQLENYGYEIQNEDTQNQSLPLLSKGYHHSRNIFIKGIKGHLFRSLSNRAFRYKY